MSKINLNSKTVGIKHVENHVNTLYLNYELEYKGKEYTVCVDWGGGIQDIEIRENIDDGSDYESLYSEDSMFSAKDRLEIIEIVKEALTQTDFTSNITISN